MCSFTGRRIISQSYILHDHLLKNYIGFDRPVRKWKVVYFAENQTMTSQLHPTIHYPSANSNYRYSGYSLRL